MAIDLRAPPLRRPLPAHHLRLHHTLLRRSQTQLYLLHRIPLHHLAQPRHLPDPLRQAPLVGPHPQPQNLLPPPPPPLPLPLHRPHKLPSIEFLFITIFLLRLLKHHIKRTTAHLTRKTLVLPPQNRILAFSLNNAFRAILSIRAREHHNLRASQRDKHGKARRINIVVCGEIHGIVVIDAEGYC
ncbi:hypothetical protein BJX66DRAFT_320315 [Aspergillus keveii]|uniref:Uncharacterized protein n=1 Tax=Aspergillus keveii TaxID=714993 RepID=A0ABR4FH89_9EURO